MGGTERGEAIQHVLCKKIYSIKGKIKSNKTSFKSLKSMKCKERQQNEFTYFNTEYF